MTLYIKRNNNFLALLMSLGLAVLLTGCGGGESTTTSILQPGPAQPELSPAEQLAASGNWLASAQAWREQAANETSPHQETSLLQAAEMLLRAHAHDDARQLLNEIVIVNASQEQQVQLQLLKTRLALAERRPTDAQAELDILNALTLDEIVQADILALRANIYAQTGHHYDAARQRIRLDILLDFEGQEDNHNQIWEALSILNTVALDTLRRSEADQVTTGWLDLAWLVKSTHQQGTRLALALQDWQSRYPQHPASYYILPTLKTLDQFPISRQQNVALLLPLDGKFANAARAVRDGFFNAYYADNINKNTASIRVYSADNNNVASVYEQAVVNGADIVVGPLDKDALLALLTREEFNVPVLALNDIPGAPLPGGVYSFALSPEDEARQVAEHIWLDGHSRGIALYPQSRWGERIYDAFRNRWQELGGELVEASSYVTDGHDFANPVRQLLNIDESKIRHRYIRSQASEDIKFEMRRRQDIDFVFLAGYPKQARQLRPQFDFYNAGSLPVYATSHVYSGTPDRKADRDMNGITFGDMPWTIANQDTDKALRDAVQRNWAKDRKAYTRLFAFGVDAWRLLPHIERLSRYRFARVAGSTGSLRVDEYNRVHRGLKWAAFKAGEPRIIQPPLLSPAAP